MGSLYLQQVASGYRFKACLCVCVYFTFQIFPNIDSLLYLSPLPPLVSLFGWLGVSDTTSVRLFLQILLLILGYLDILN